jgi:ABC-2 type transport system permease protein
MSPLRTTWATLKRELLGYFVSPVSYLVLGLFALVQGYGFFLLCQTLAKNQASTSAVLQYFFGGTFLYWLFLMFVVSVLTMRLVAEERQQGTLEPLLTAPVGEGALALGKYLAAVGFYACLWVPTLAFPLLLRAYAGPGAMLDGGPIAAGYLGTLLCGASALGIGLLCSALSRSQLLAAVLSFVLLTLLLLIGMLADLYAQSAAVRQALLYVNLLQHMDEFGRGIVDSRRVVLHLSLAAATVLLAGRALRARPGDTAGGLRAGAEALAVLALLVGVNLIAARHPLRGDWTHGGLYALSPRTQALLAELGPSGKRVGVTVLQADTGERDELTEALRELLQRAERAAGGALQVEQLDVDRDREKARLAAERFHIERDDLRLGVVVVHSEGRSKFILRHDLGDYEPGGEGGPQPLRAFRGEEALAAAILTVTAGRTPTLCFTVGHGEPEHDSLTGSGLSELSAALQRENFSLRDLPALAAADGGADPLAGCDVVAIIGPEKAFLPAEVAALGRYLDRGGRALFLLGALIDRGVTEFLDLGLSPLLDRAGIRLGNAVVTDPEHRVGSSLAFLVEQTYADHPVTAAIAGHRTVWPLARPVRARSAPGWQAQELVSTGEKGYAETDLDAIRTGELAYTAEQDEAGPIPLAAAAHATGSEARLVVLGCSQLVWNDSLVLWNRDLVVSAVQWLADVQVRVGIAAKRPEQLRLTIQDDQQTRLFLVLVLGLPLMAALLGAGVLWIRRR